MPSTMQHLNGHIVCALDCETTGLIPGFHEIVQFTVLALDHTLQIDKSVIPFDILIRPIYPNRLEDEAKRKMGTTFIEAMDTGLDAEAALDLFANWVRHKLCMPEKHRIVPLGCNLQFDFAFIRQWMGIEHVNYYFDSRWRDVLCTANYLNDRANFGHEQIPFAGRMGLSRLAHRMGIEVDESQLHDALYDCKISAETYRMMLTQPLF